MKAGKISNELFWPHLTSIAVTMAAVSVVSIPFIGTLITTPFDITADILFHTANAIIRKLMRS